MSRRSGQVGVCVCRLWVLKHHFQALHPNRIVRGAHQHARAYGLFMFWFTQLNYDEYEYMNFLFHLSNKALNS